VPLFLFLRDGIQESVHKAVYFERKGCKLIVLLLHSLHCNSVITIQTKQMHAVSLRLQLYYKTPNPTCFLTTLLAENVWVLLLYNIVGISKKLYAFVGLNCNIMIFAFLPGHIKRIVCEHFVFPSVSLCTCLSSWLFILFTASSNVKGV